MLWARGLSKPIKSIDVIYPPPPKVKKGGICEKGTEPRS